MTRVAASAADGNSARLATAAVMYAEHAAPLPLPGECKESPAATGDSGDSHPWLGTPGAGDSITQNFPVNTSETS